MRTTITARHVDVSAEIRHHAAQLMARLGKVAARPHDAQIIFDGASGRCAVELRLHTARGKVFVAGGAGPDHRTALDRAAQRLRRQLERERPRRAGRARARGPARGAE